VLQSGEKSEALGFEGAFDLCGGLEDFVGRLQLQNWGVFIAVFGGRGQKWVLVLLELNDLSGDLSGFGDGGLGVG
jgi:hypothetical protein